MYQLVGDEEALEQLVSIVLGSGALAALTLSAEDAYLQVLTDATDTACNYLLLREEADHLPSLPYQYGITGTPEKMAQDSIWRAARKLPVLKRAALALSDLLNLDPSQVARVLRQPPDYTERFIEEARNEYALLLEEITHLRGQFPLANIAPAIALGLRPRYGYAKSAYALLPPFELPDERLAILKWNAVQHQDDEDDDDEPDEAPIGAAPGQRAAGLPLQPALFAFALVALLIGGWLLGTTTTRSPSSSSLAMAGASPTPTGTPTVVLRATPVLTGAPSGDSTATPTLVPVPTATDAPGATPDSETTAEPDFTPLPTGTSTPGTTRRSVPRATNTPARVFVAAPTRTPTRTPRPPTATVPSQTPAPPTSTPSVTATATPAVPSATPLQSPTATGVPPTATNTPTSPPPTPTRTPTPVPPTATNTPTSLPPTPTRTPTLLSPTATLSLPTATPVP